MLMVGSVVVGQERAKGRSLQNDVERLQEELLRAQRAVKSAETLQVPFSMFTLAFIQDITTRLVRTGGRHSSPRPTKSFTSCDLETMSVGH